MRADAAAHRRGESILVSTAHQTVQPGASVVAKLGGIHDFARWDGAIISDSGDDDDFEPVSP